MGKKDPMDINSLVKYEDLTGKNINVLLGGLNPDSILNEDWDDEVIGYGVSFELRQLYLKVLEGEILTLVQVLDDGLCEVQHNNKTYTLEECEINFTP